MDIKKTERLWDMFELLFVKLKQMAIISFWFEYNDKLTFILSLYFCCYFLKVHCTALKGSHFDLSFSRIHLSKIKLTIKNVTSVKNVAI